jgi:hypothetical protein
LFDPDRDGHGADAPALASRSARTQRPSLCWMVSTSSSASSLRLRAQPTSSARMT